MKRVLWVSAIPPSFDGGGGGEIRQAHLIDALAARFEVRLLLAGTLRDERIRDRVFGVREVPVSARGDPPQRARRRIRDLRWQVVERQPEEVARLRPVRRALAPWLTAASGADIVCIEYIGLAPLLPRQRRGIWSLTLHNLTSEMARHGAAIARGPRQRLMLGLEHRNSSRIERWAARSYDLLVAVSEQDAAMLPGGVAVVPNGVDTLRFRPSPLPAGPRVVFTGALHTLPNRDGISWFCDQVWPQVRRRLDHATLDIVGSAPPAEVLALARNNGVYVHSDVPDVIPFLKRASASVVPLRIGTGSRIKALEAMAAGRPVAGTTIGLGGLDARPGYDVLIADGAGALADAVVRCLVDRDLAAKLAANGRMLVERRHSWSRIGRDYAALLEERTAAPRQAL